MHRNEKDLFIKQCEGLESSNIKTLTNRAIEQIGEYRNRSILYYIDS